jgi:cell division protein FtsW (lipid II flippase)
MTTREHSRIYEALLAAVALSLLLAIVSLNLATATSSAESNRSSRTDRAEIHRATVASVAFAALAFFTIAMRHAMPKPGRSLTKALNIVLLVLFPLGTALGLYGLMKVDRFPDSGA